MLRNCFIKDAFDGYKVISDVLVDIMNLFTPNFISSFF